MRVERALLEELPEKKFNIGYQGELNHTQVIISCPIMFRDYPDAVASMVVKPPQGDLYPVSLTRDGNDLTWDVSDADVAIPGEGILQMTFTDGEGEEAEIIKTVYGSYSVNASLVANGEAPDPVQSWLDEAGAALATFENEIGDIRKITTATEEDEGLALSPKTVANGKVTEWEYIDLADPEVVTQAIDDWLDDHPEATTTVQDGAITEAKLNSTLKDDLAWKDDVDGLMSAINQSKAPTILDTASGEIVTIPDGADGMAVETLTVAIEPVQDLHGYDNPWPAGGGKNYGKQIPSKTDVGITATLLNNGTVLVNGTATGYFYTESIFTLEAGSYLLSRGSNPGVSNIIVQIRDASTDALLCTATNTGASITLSEDKQIKFRIAVNNTASTSNVVVEPMIRLSTVEDSTFAPYSNLCPISGWSAAEVVRTGKNLVDKSQVVQGTINSSGQNQNSTYRLRTDYTRIKGGETYYMSYSPSKIRADFVFFYDKNKTLLSYISTMSTDSFTTPDNCEYIRITLYKNEAGNLEVSELTAFQVELGTSGTAFEAYHATQTKTYTFPSAAGTVYGGTLAVNADGTGSLVVDRKMITDFTGLVANGISSTGAYRYKLEDSTLAGYGEGMAISNLLEFKAEFNGKANTFYNGTSVINIFLAQSTLETAKAFLSDNSAQVVCPLTTPVTYTLTAEAVSLLLGVNNLWADCGNVSIEYPCDTKLYVDKKIMEAIANALNA